LANGKEIQELDITPLLDMQSAVLEDECELDLLGLDRWVLSDFKFGLNAFNGNFLL
jgi:hypothetical protein